MEPNRRVDRQRLDLVLADVARAATDPVTRAQVEGFEQIIRTRSKDWQQPAFDSVRQEIAEFVMPRITNAGIFNSAQYMEILDRVLEQLLPALGTDDEIVGIARAVIEEEIDRHRELQDRIHEALGV